MVLVSGSDEHGAPIEVEALKQGISPRRLTNKNHRLIRRLLKAYNIRFDNYTRTESPVHKKFVRQFYKKVEKNGYVYNQTLILPYCEQDKRFLPDRFVEGECPFCHSQNARGDQCDNCGRILEPTDLIKPRCVIDGATPVLRPSKHWFFDLPKLAPGLQKYIEGNANLPENARNFSLSWLKEGLKPRSLTRDILWGIPAPFKGAEKKTIYVWMEAVLGYISATKEWSEKKGDPRLWKTFWTNPESRNVHFIGKDNIPFHTIIFPGLLEASGGGYNLPWQVSSTEYIQFEGQKFSKSRRIGIWMDEALDLVEAEYWRYALVSLRPEQKDANFTLEEFERKINTELNDVVGNFVHRTVSFLQTHYDGMVPAYKWNETAEQDVTNIMKQAPSRVERKFEEFRIKEALEEVVAFAREGNRYLNEREPWRIYKGSRESAGQTLGIAIQIVGTLAILLQPFLPASAAVILTAVSGRKTQDWSYAGRNFIKAGSNIQPLEPLFHKVSASALKERLENLRSIKNADVEA